MNALPPAHSPVFTAGFLDLASSLAGVQAAKALGFEMMELRAGDQVLDIGCGTGTDAIALAKQGAALGACVTGVDIDQAMVEAAISRARDLDLPLRFLQASIHALPFDDAAFDIVRIDRVLHFLPDPAAALAAACRVVRPGGRIVVTEPDWSTLDIRGGDPGLAAKVLPAGLPQGATARIGGSLDRLFADCGLELIGRRRTCLELEAFGTAMALFSLDGLARRAVDAGAMAPGEAALWLRSLQQAAERGEFRVALGGAIASGRRSTSDAAY